MTKGVKVALASVAAFVLAVGVEVLYIHHRRAVDENAPPPNAAAKAEVSHMDDDEAVAYTLKKQRPDSLADERQLIGKNVWVSAGDQLDYYKDAGRHVDYAHPVGMLHGADPLLVRDVFEQKAPASGRAVQRITAGQRHVLLAFTLPNSADPKQLYATPVGHFADGVYEFISDDVLFYDDPHTLYKHWSTEAWKHVDKHECVPGMNEAQCMLALGQTVTWHGDKAGNRSITYNNGGDPVTATFENGKATRVVKGE